MRALALLAALLAAWGPAASAEAGVALRAESLDPRFDDDQSDYTLPASTCSERFTLEVSAPGRSRARIGDRAYFNGTESRRLKLDPGQAVRVKTKRGDERDRYYVRCLPDDFPTYTYERSSQPASDLYVVTPASMAGQASPNYLFIFDRHGVPVWWRTDPDDLSTDGKVLEDGSIAFARSSLPSDTDFESGYEIHRPDGTLKRVVQSVGHATDPHDLQMTDDGNYLVLSYVQRATRVNATPYGGERAARVEDAVIQKVSPSGVLLWEWNSKDHIGLEETGRWWERFSGQPYDLVHINAVEETANGDYLISLRHTDAVYRLDGESGAIEWKLGGTPRAESLEVAGDPYAGTSLFGAQHDVRERGDGTITLHDNGTDLGRAPRAVRYEISGGVATLVDSRSDPEVTDSPCCGSARYVNGAWIASWGGTGTVSELEGGERTFALEFDRDAGTVWSYRAFPVDGETDTETLREGMNDQVPLKK